MDLVYQQKYLKYKLKYKELKNQIGGDHNIECYNKFIAKKNEELYQKMCDFKGNFVLVIGSNSKEKWFEYFCSLIENQDKMVISLDNDMDLKYKNNDLQNNLYLNFNHKTTWNFLNLFNNRFYKVIFDYAVCHLVDQKENIDIIKEIYNLLIKHGKLYIYNTLKIVDTEIREETKKIPKSDIDIIIKKFHTITPQEIMIIKDLYYRINISPYGEHYIYGNSLSLNYLTSRTSDFNSDDYWIFLKEQNNIRNYLKFLYVYKNRIYIENILTKKYNFNVTSYDDHNYPLCNPKIDFSSYYQIYCIATK